MNWDQLAAILWLRWRLTRNQWSRSGGLNAILTVAAAVIGVVLGVAGGLGGFVAGLTVLSKADALILRSVWDAVIFGFLIFWMLGIVTDIQRSEAIDLSRLMHLPVSLWDVFVMNYVASHLTLSVAMFLPVSLGLCAGLALGRDATQAMLVPEVLAFLVMITAWTYCLRGWLAKLMINPRRRRATVVGATMAFVLLMQLPNLIMNTWVVRHRPTPGDRGRWLSMLESAHDFVPLLWLPQGAKSLAEHRWLPSIAGTLSMIALGALGLWRAHHSTVRFYLGGETTGAARPAPSVAPAPGSRRRLLERQLPGVSEEAAAVALGGLRSLTRAPEVKMAMAINVIVVVFLFVTFVFKGRGNIPEQVRLFLPSMAAVITFLGILQIQFNQFGFDREGFRAYVLLPASRGDILLGKNLALLPLALSIFLVILVLTSFTARLSVLEILEAPLLFLASYCVMSVLGNLVSILAPYRIMPGSMKPSKTTATTSLLSAILGMTFPIVLLPSFAPGAVALLCRALGWGSGLPASFLAAMIWTVVAGACYGVTLGPMGRLLQRREQRILDLVTQEVE